MRFSRLRLLGWDASARYQRDWHRYQRKTDLAFSGILSKQFHPVWSSKTWIKKPRKRQGRELTPQPQRGNTMTTKKLNTINLRAFLQRSTAASLCPASMNLMAPTGAFAVEARAPVADKGAALDLEERFTIADG